MANSLNKPHSITFWFTGLSGAGKSTVAYAFEKYLKSKNISAYVIDGDEIRKGLSSDLGFSEIDRAENMRRVAEISKIMNEAGIIIITSLISPYIKDRAIVKNIIGDNYFYEIYISTPIEICEQRDIKGLYAKARSGNLDNFTGISSLYQKPVKPKLIIDTSVDSIAQAVNALYDLLNDI